MVSLGFEWNNLTDSSNISLNCRGLKTFSQTELGKAAYFDFVKKRIIDREAKLGKITRD